MNKKKKILICGLSISIIVVCLALIYIFTDLFKTKEQLFFKYIVKQKDEIESVLSNNEIKQFNIEEKNSSYIKEGNIKVDTGLEILKPVNIKITEKGNNKDKIRNTFIDAEYNNLKLANATIIKDNDYYLIKSNLLSDKYLAVENNNLKDLAKDFGIQNTEYIPDKVNEIDYTELFEFTDDEIIHILKEYIPIYRKHVKNNDYIKRKNVKLDKSSDNLTSIEVQLSEKQVNDLMIELLKNLHEDDKTINIINKKINIINPESKYTNNEMIKEKISDLIEYFSSKDVKDEKFLSIIIYKKLNNVIKTELVLNNERIFSIERNDDENKLIFKQYGVKGKKIDISSIEGIIKTVINSLEEITLKMDIVDSQTSKVEISCKFNIGIDKVTINYNYVKKIENNVEDLIYKKDVEFIELKKYIEENKQNIIEKINLNLVFKSLNKGLLNTGKNY